jgi:hypothetical protein
MTQPSQGVLFELTNPLVGEMELLTQLSQRTGRMSIQAVASDDDLTQMVRQSGEKRAQGIIHQKTLDVLLQFRRLQPWRRDQFTHCIARGLRGGAPNVTPNGHPGIGRESCTPLRIVPQDSPPEADATGLQRSLIG